MVDYNGFGSRNARLGVGAAVLLALGAAGGAGAVTLTRPTVEMAPTVPTAIARLPQKDGVVTVKGRVAEVYGDRLVVQDASGRTMIDAGRGSRGRFAAGAPVTVQGRYDDGQLRASYVVDGEGRIDAVGPVGRPPHGPGGPGRNGPPPPPPGGPGVPPPPPPSCTPAPEAATAPPVAAPGAQPTARPAS